MTQPITEGVNEIDSFDAYYSNVHISEMTLIVPYINLGLSRHPLNREERLKYIDFAYLVCRGLRYLKVQRGVLRGRRETAGALLYFGGFHMDEAADLIDFEIGCELSYLLPLPDSRIADTCWIPVESPKKNLDAGQVKAFFGGERMPESIRNMDT